MVPEVLPIQVPRQDQSSSPVTWHVLTWTLLTLGISSMGQPPRKLIGTPSRYRIYLSSSPIFCIADALSAIIKLTTFSIFLPISFQKALGLVVYASSDFQRKEGEEPHAWPRWIFFIIGTLPAAIKLCSFSETPWSQAWGLMFGVSFIVNEILSSFGSSDENKSVESILGFTASQWEDDTNTSLRIKVTSLGSQLQKFDNHFCLIALLSHLALLTWAAVTLWPPISKIIGLSPRVGSWISIIFSTIYLLLSLIYVITYCFQRKLSQHYWPLFLKIQEINFVWVLLPSHDVLWKDPESQSWIDRYNREIFLVLYFYLFLCSGTYGGFLLVGEVIRRWPGVGRVLLLDYTTGRLERNGTLERKIDLNAWLAFFFFLVSLGMCVLWYAFAYVEEGTVQLAWTDVFG